MPKPAGTGSDAGDDLPHLDGVRLSRGGPLLATPKTGRGHHLHGLGYLLHVFGAADPVFDRFGPLQASLTTFGCGFAPLQPLLETNPFLKSSMHCFSLFSVSSFRSPV